ncbi:MAG: hypothetical protein CMB82_11735 [Flammeovirgaceae bacterium]|nr:hypothetical protein [Flammeovirgaceae bacterium]
MNMMRTTLFLIFTLEYFFVLGQTKINSFYQETEKIQLYPEGISCQNDLKEKMEIDISGPGRFFKKVVDPEIWYYPSSKKSNNSEQAAVLVIPGGGYYFLAFDKEGVEVAKFLNSLGVSAFVLKHRVPFWESTNCRSQVALLDAQRAIRIIRNNSKKWNINPNKIGVLGFSAGGHLASTLSTHHDNGLERSKIKVERSISSRPDFTILIYPVVTMQDNPFSHMGSRKNLLGNLPTIEQLNYFSNDLQVKADTPPALLIHTNEDKGVPAENSIFYYLALRKNNIPAALHIWEKGRHGLGLGTDDIAFSNWPLICKEWMIERGILN